MRRLFGKIVLPLLLAVALCMAPVSAAPDANKDKENTDSAPIKKQVLSADFETVLENDKYRFSIKTEDGNIAVTDKKSGIIRYANPINAQDDELAIGGKGEVLKSQILVQYYENDSIVVNNSYADAAKNNNISYSVENDVLYVNYLMGDDEFDTNLIPMILTKERMEKDILSKLSEDEKEEILDRFRLYERKELDPEALKGMEITYPSLKKYDIYVRGAIPAFKAKDFYELFVKAGYTVEDLQKDYDQNELENPYKPKPSFDITLEYSLTDDGFKVDVDPKKIKYVENFKPVRIDILPYFDAADSKDSGFIFVPDGSGSLINLNNNKYTVNTYEKRLFETDNAQAESELIAPYQESVLPVFALSGSKSGFYATIDSGYEEGGVAAGVSGVSSFYNNVYPFFDLLSHGTISYSSTSVASNVLIMTENFITSKLSVAYHFISGGTSYSQIAVSYRELLQKQGLLPEKSVSDNVDINVKLIGSAYVQKRFLGIPYTSITSMTDYDEAAKILEKLEGLNTEVNYINAMPGGSLQKNLTKFKPLSVLGSKKERKELAEKTARLTFSYNAQYATKIKNGDTAKKLDRSNARKYKYDIVGRVSVKSNSLKVLSPAVIVKYADKAVKKFNKYDIDSVNIQDLGYLLCSDFNVDAQFDRYKARQNVQKYLEKLSKDRYVSLTNGSVYSLAFADKITDIPITHTGYKIEDTAVPFYQIVLSGIIPYTTASVNSADEGILHFLKTVETGAQLQYTWYYEKPDNLTYNSEDYYGMSYESTIDEAKAYALKYKPLYEKISGKAIVEHKYVSETLSETVYENGITVYVNYSDSSVKIKGTTVNALDYAMIGG